MNVLLGDSGGEVGIDPRIKRSINYRRNTESLTRVRLIGLSEYDCQELSVRVGGFLEVLVGVPGLRSPDSRDPLGPLRRVQKSSSSLQEGHQKELTLLDRTTKRVLTRRPRGNYTTQTSLDPSPRSGTVVNSIRHQVPEKRVPGCVL